MDADFADLAAGLFGWLLSFSLRLAFARKLGWDELRVGEAGLVEGDRPALELIFDHHVLA